jgi:hypothetical protein
MDVSGDPSQGVYMTRRRQRRSVRSSDVIANAGVHDSRYLMTCRGCPESISLLPTWSNSDAAELVPTLNGKCAPPDQLDRART